MQKTLTIFHTNDIHSHFENWPRMVQQISRFRTEEADDKRAAFYFDCGDFMDRANPLTEGTLGQGNTLLLNQMKTDAVTIGNNEGITLTKEELDALYQEAEFPVLVCNLFNEDGERPTWAKPSTVLATHNGLRVGVAGVTVPFRAFYESLGWTVKDPLDILPDIISDLKKECDLVVVLSHLGLSDDQRVAKELHDIDVILGAHTHHILPEGLSVNDTLICQTGKFGMYLGKVELSFDDKTKKVVSKKASLMDLEGKDEQKQSAELLSQLQQKGVDTLKKEVVVLNQPLPVSWYEPSPFAQLMADALREWCKTSISMINSGVILESLPAGPVTKGDLHRICPHPINPCIVDLTGDEVKEIVVAGLSEEMIHKEVKGFGFRGKVMGRMAFSGIDVEEAVLDDGKLHVQSIFIDGEPVCDDKKYRIAVIDMFTFGKLYPAIARNTTKTFMLPETLRDLLEWKLQQ